MTGFAIKGLVYIVGKEDLPVVIRMVILGESHGVGAPGEHPIDRHERTAHGKRDHPEQNELIGTPTKETRSSFTTANQHGSSK